MNIITVFNYDDDEKYNTMFKIWTLQCLKVKSQTPEIKKIKILTLGLNEKLKYFINQLNNKHIEICICGKINFQHGSSKFKHNVGFKLYNICKEIEPYIFIDADAIPITDFKDVIQASKDKPFIGVNHQTIEGHTKHFNYKFINTGFLIVSNPEFLNFEKILNTPMKFTCPGTDQTLIYNYCKTLNYDYTHKLIHYGWNSCGGFIKELDNGEVVSDKIIEKHKVHIIHYWFNYKPWIINCPIYNKLKINII